MTAPAILAAAREAVALEERSRWGPARFVQPDDDDEGVAYDRQREAELDWQQHALANCPAIATALLEAEAEGQRLRGGDGDVRVLVARELLPSLAEWSEPLQVRMEGEQLVFRRPAALARRDHPTAEPEE